MQWHATTIALVIAIMITYFIIKELSVLSRRTMLIPNRNMRRRPPRIRSHIRTIFHGHRYLINTAYVPRIEEYIRSTHRTYGHAVGVVSYKIRKMGIIIVGRQSFIPLHSRVCEHVQHFAYTHHPNNLNET